jgi:pyruvate dehydrogenase E2 component (dihydrolipoyllysine-residue acetyltransferase)
MATDVVMPRLSDSMEEGTVLKWLVDVGGEVKRGAPLVEIETDKANMTYEADTDGVLVEVVASEGDTLEVGQVIARIGDPGDATGPRSSDIGHREEAPAEPAEEPEAAPEPEKAEHRAPSTEHSNGGERVKASPVARRVAGELGVELANIEGTGPGGRIVKADVEKAGADGAAKPQAEPAPEPEPRGPTTEDRGPSREPIGAKGATDTRDLTRLQRTVSRRMAEAKATAPDFFLELDVDMTMCIELRSRLKKQVDPAPSFNDMVVKAAALALRDHPRVNGAYRDGRWELYERVNVGVAVAAQDALVVPVVPDADEKSLGEISRQARRLIERVRDGQITPPELSGGTFTVSNLGMYGVERFTAILNPPQAAILAVGALQKKPAVDDRGRVVARDLMSLTLVCDHRILYGADGAQFLARVREILEQPLSLAL